MAAPLFDAISASQFFSFASNGSYSHTCSGSNRALYVVLIIDDSGTTMSTVTYNGVSMSLKQALTTGNTFASGNWRLEIWELIAPASGSNTVSWAASNGSNSIESRAISFQDVDQSTSTGSVATQGPGIQITPVVTISSATGELGVVFNLHAQGGVTATENGSQTNQWTWNGVRSLCSTIAGASSLTMGYTLSTLDDSSTIGFSLKPVAGGGGGAFIPIIGRGPGMALAGRGGLVALSESSRIERVTHVLR